MTADTTETVEETTIVKVDEKVKAALESRQKFFSDMLELGKANPMAFLGIVYETGEAIGKIIVRAEKDFGIKLNKVEHIIRNEDEKTS